MEVPVIVDLKKGIVELNLKIKLNITDLRGYAFMEDNRLIPLIERAVLDGLSVSLAKFSNAIKSENVLIKIRKPEDGEDEEA
jgi:hypothetical protein